MNDHDDRRMRELLFAYEELDAPARAEVDAAIARAGGTEKYGGPVELRMAGERLDALAAQILPSAGHQSQFDLAAQVQEQAEESVEVSHAVH